MVYYILLHFVGIHLKYSILYLKRCLSVPSHYQYWLQIIDIHPRAISQNISKIWWQFLCTCQWSLSWLASPVLLGSQWVNPCLPSPMHDWAAGAAKPDDPASSLKTVSHQTALRNIMFHSFVYTSRHCRRWRSRMEVKIMAGSLFVHCKIAYFYSVTADKWLILSLPNFVTIRRTHFSVSCKIFSWIRSTKLKIHAVEFCDFIKDSVSPSGLFVPCSLTVTSTWRPRLTAHCPIGERH